ncbi:MAG: hypothetical protein HOC71_02865, partial [Candidatus Latescibacteria bacterium]|nr:hypothetical protein [Candidatus Latescibacterota bacterium]
KENPKRDFDEILESMQQEINTHQKNMTPPKHNDLHRIGLITRIMEQLESISIESEHHNNKNLQTNPKVLPVYRGYTVDKKLREFRKIIIDTMPEFIPFDSRKGEALLVLLDEERPDIMKELIEQM